ncbi:MAG: hypothetical protein Q8900_05870 [Bacillota bacterium]|nr:hypothetical protein [Bacillota bacterium]
MMKTDNVIDVNFYHKKRKFKKIKVKQKKLSSVLIEESKRKDKFSDIWALSPIILWLLIFLSVSLLIMAFVKFCT